MNHPPTRRNWRQALGLSAVLLALVVALSTLPIVRDSELRLTDTFFRLAPPPNERSKVVLVLIDDDSLRQYGRWPWSRDLLARLTTKVSQAGAGAIGLDILLSEPQSAAADHALADALRTSHAVIVDKIGIYPDGPHWIEPLSEFSQAAAAVGHAHAVLDTDSVCRRFPPRELTLDGSRWALAVEVARRIDPKQTSRFLAGHGVPFADDAPTVSVAKPILARIAYRRDGFDTISAKSVLNGTDLAALRGRPVLVGFGPTEIGDRLTTPLTLELPTPGVEVHAQILDGILNGRMLRGVPLWFSALLLVFSCGLATVVFRRWHGWAALVLLLASLVVVYICAFSTFLWALRVLPVGSLMLAFLLAPLLVYSADFVLVERGMTRQLLGLRFWLQRRSKEGPILDKSDLSWKLDLLHDLQTELGSLYELHKTLLESTQDLVAIFDERGALLLNNQLFAQRCQPPAELPFSIEQLRAQLKPGDGVPVPLGESTLEGEVYLGNELYSLRSVPLPPTTVAPGGGTIVTMTSLRTRVERDRARAEALGFITHELRTPLVSIQGFAELMMRYPNSPSCATAPDTIFRESKRLLALINSYLDVLRLDAGAKPLSPDVFEVDSAVRKVFDILQPQAAAAKMPLFFEPGDPVPMVGDATLITGAILNLVSNAIKYGKPGTEIRVRCLRQDNEVVVSVSNTGEPIAGQEIPRLFDAYYRSSNAETSKPGWGLGLAFVKRIAEKHGGTVSVLAEGSGTSFQIHLPAQTNMAAAKETV